MIQHAGEQISARASPGIRMAFFDFPLAKVVIYRKNREGN
jgi:hypothetical protein